MLASTGLSPDTEPSPIKTNIGLAPILDPNGGNDQTYVLISKPPSDDETDVKQEEAKVDIMIQAIPYGPSGWWRHREFLVCVWCMWCR